MRHGGATIVESGDQVTINQTTGMAILDWHSFSIAQGETTKFVQPNSSSMALNRVNGGTQSLINGRLEANGGIVLINPAGIIVGKSGVINVNSFIASTHDVTDEDFLSGKGMKFQGSSEASIQNLGTIHAESGDIFLIAHSVINEGTLSAKNGTVGLVAANEVLLQPSGDEKLSILSKEASTGKISHSGTIEAVSAEIKAAGNPYAVAINLDGLIQAKRVSDKKARVIVKAEQGDIQMSKAAKIDAGGDTEGGKVIVQTKGSLEIAGTVLATSATGNGGEVQLLGDSIHLGPTAVVDGSGFAGGGNIFVGGDYQGGNNPDVHYSSTALPNAQTLLVEQGAKLIANATGNGNGGTIIQWSDGTTVSSGSVSVQGGPLGGNGGFTEISGKQNLGFNGTVDLAAPKGKAGTVLFDPSDLWIVGTTGSIADAVTRYNSILNLYNNPPPPTWFTILTRPVLTDPPTGSVMTASSLNSISSGTILITAANITFSGESDVSFRGSYWGGYGVGMINANYHETYYGNPAVISLQNSVNLNVTATGNIYMPSGSSITTSGAGWIALTSQAGNVSLLANSSINANGTGNIWVTANNNLYLAGQITSANGNIALQSQYGNLELIQGSKVRSTGGGGLILQSERGSISGASELSTADPANGYVNLLASTGLSFSGPINAGLNIFAWTSTGDVDLKGSIATGYIDIWAISGYVTLNGSFAAGNVIPVSGGNYITVVAGNSLTLGNLLPTSLSAPNNLTLSAPLMNLTATFQTASPDRISLNNLAGANSVLGGIVLSFLNNLNLNSSSTSLNQFSSHLGTGSFFTVQAPNIDIQNATISLNPNVSLSLIATGSSSIPGTLNFTGDTISIHGSGNISLVGNGNVSLSGSSITAEQGTITIASLTGNLDLAAQIASAQPGNAVGLSAVGNFNASANASIATPNGRWVIYSTDPALNSVLSPSLQSGNAIYAKTATSLPPSSVPPSGNYYVYSAPIVVTTLLPPVTIPNATPVPTPASTATALNAVVTTLVSTPSFMRVASAVMAAPPSAGGGMGPVGSPMGGGFGSAGPSGGMGGFSSAPSPSAPAPGGGSQAGGSVAAAPSSSSASGAPASEGAAPPPPGGEGSSGGESAPAPTAPGESVAGGSGGEAAPGAPAPAAPNGAAPAEAGSQASSSGAGGLAPAGAPGGAGLAGTAASAPHVPASVAAANRMNNPIPSSVGPAHSLNAMSGGSEHGAVEAGEGSVSGGPGAGPGKAASSVGGRSGTMGFGSDPQSAESANSMITTIMTVL